jgi:hypothetical protein
MNAFKAWIMRARVADLVMTAWQTTQCQARQ